MLHSDSTSCLITKPLIYYLLLLYVDWPGVRYAQGLRLACVPINDTSPDADWRNREINDIVKTHSYFGIRVIPFYNETVPLWDMHVNGHKQDCTHFCWTPMLYQYLFHYMRNSIVPSVAN